jgi:hypothetical protein
MAVEKERMAQQLQNLDIFFEESLSLLVLLGTNSTPDFS